MKMSRIPMEIPTLEINEDELQNLINFIYKHEHILKEIGEIKIEPNAGCKLALIKQRENNVLCSNTEKLVRIDKDGLVYSIKKINNINKSAKQSSLRSDECCFWSSLSSSINEGQPRNISILENKSFFSQNRSRAYLDIHRLPGQSLLKLGGRKVIRQLIPSIKRAHGPAAIFPLTSARQRLFSINYHHEGENHHWYIIPARERDLLQKILEQKGSSVCLDHGNLLIDPSILDKNHIRYYRTRQRPNEFVVLSAGTLSQSYTKDASWTETIDFALPSWIEEGHATLSSPTCQCHIDHEFLSEPIDVNLFRQELIQKYIDSDLNIDTDDNSLSSINSSLLLSLHYSIIYTFLDDNHVNTVVSSTSNNIDTTLSNAETTISANMKLFMPVESQASSFQSPPSSSVRDSNDKYVDQQGNKKSDANSGHVQYELLDEGYFTDIFDQKTTDIAMMDSFLSEDLFADDIQTSQLHQNNPISTNIDQNFTNNSKTDSYFLSYEQMMDWPLFNSDTISATYRQTPQSINLNSPSTLSSNTQGTVGNDQHARKNQRSLDQITDNHETLFLTGLRRDVNKNDIRNHCTGCTKVTIKRCPATPHLKYAFVLHRTIRQARHNMQRSIDHDLLGHQCRIEYANDRLTLCDNQQSFDQTKLVISRIPENISENDLLQLFVNCHIVKYCPARNIHLPITKTRKKSRNKTVLGHAFIRYDTEQQAVSVLEHVDQYQINGQPLLISIYRNKNSAYSSTKETLCN